LPRLAVGVVEVLLADHREYLTVERGLTADTIEATCWAVRPFLNGRLGDGDGLDLSGLTAAEVVAFVVAQCSRPPLALVRRRYLAPGDADASTGPIGGAAGRGGCGSGC